LINETEDEILEIKKLSIFSYNRFDITIMIQIKENNKKQKNKSKKKDRA